MNFKTPLLLACAMLTTCIYAQSVNLANKTFNVNYVALPTNPILEDANRTYQINSINSEVLTQSFPSYYFESEVNIPGFSKLSADAFLTVESKLIDVNLISSEIESETKVSKDDEGNETRTTYYWAVVTYSTEGQVSISSADGLISETLGFSGEKTKTSDKSKSWDVANSFRKKNRSKALRIEYVKNVIRSVNNTLGSSYGYRDIKTTNTFSIVKSKKHPEKDAQAENYELLRTAFDGMTSDQPIDQLKAEIAPAITYFSGIMDKYPGDDRKSRKLKKAALYNLATIHYYLDEPDMTIKYADMMLDNDKGKVSAKNLKKRAESLKEGFATNNTNTRHFKVITEDNTDYQVGAIVDNGGAEEEVPISENPDYTLSYVMTVAGDTVPAYVNSKRINKLGSVLTTYVKDLQGKFVERGFNADDVEQLVLGNGEKFRTIPFKEASDAVSLGGGNSGRKFVKQLFVAGNLKLYRYQTDQLIIKKKGAKLGYNTSSAGWVLGFKKKLGGLVKEECPALAERAKNKEFANNADGLIEFMRAYKECGSEAN